MGGWGAGSRRGPDHSHGLATGQAPAALPRPQVAISALQTQTQGGEVSADAAQLADGRRGASNSRSPRWCPPQGQLC